MYNLVLVSKSPRRYDLLTESGYRLRTNHIEVSEITSKNLNSFETVMSLAQIKSQYYRLKMKQMIQPKDLLLTADTLVFYKNRPLGKPKDKKEAYKYLKLLSNSQHSVLTGLCLYPVDQDKEIMVAEETKVFFKDLSDEDIWTYIETGEPMDKAGAYGIQGLGGHFVESFEGEFDNVVGMPMKLFEKTLKENNLEVAKENL